MGELTSAGIRVARHLTQNEPPPAEIARIAQDLSDQRVRQGTREDLRESDWKNARVIWASRRTFPEK